MGLQKPHVETQSSKETKEDASWVFDVFSEGWKVKKKKEKEKKKGED